VWMRSLCVRGMTPRHWAVGSRTPRSFEDGGITFLRNVGNRLPSGTTSHPRRRESSVLFGGLIGYTAASFGFSEVCGITVSQMQSAVPCALGVRVAPHGDNWLRQTVFGCCSASNQVLPVSAADWAGL
jgi:hypothetical protein